MDERILRNIKRLMERQHPDIKDYSVSEYKSFYAVMAEQIQPILFEKDFGFPMFKTFASIPSSERENAKLIYTNGGSKDGKK